MHMRIEGTLKKWNDERGFGFITRADGGAEIFAHISAFPRDGQRPRIGERVTFELATGKDGKQQANRISFSTRPYRLSEPAKPRGQGGLIGRFLSLAFLVALGAYAYGEFSRRAPDATPLPVSSPPAPSTSFRCDGRKYCSQMTSCAEAEFFLRNCPGVEMDGNHDGEPCEAQWCH